MILSALNVIYSKRLPKSTQRDPLTQRSGLSHHHLSLSLPLSSGASTYAYVRLWIHAFYARDCKELARRQTNTKTPEEDTKITGLPDTHARARAVTIVRAHPCTCPWEASSCVTFTTGVFFLYPEGLDFIHGLKVAYVVCGQISAHCNHTTCLSTDCVRPVQQETGTECGDTANSSQKSL